MCTDEKKEKLQKKLDHISRETREKMLIMLRDLSKPEAYQEPARVVTQEFQQESAAF